jgi:hypothetical protein
MSKEQQNKYPWHLAPPSVMWAATDGDGDAYWYAVEPWIANHAECWIPHIYDPEYTPIGYFPELRADWQNSLEKRPGT